LNANIERKQNASEMTSQIATFNSLRLIICTLYIICTLKNYLTHKKTVAIATSHAVGPTLFSWSKPFALFSKNTRIPVILKCRHYGATVLSIKP